MTGTLKTKSFQPLAGIRDTRIFLRPYLCDTSVNRRLYYLYRKAVDAKWRRPTAPERRHGAVIDEPQPAHCKQLPVIVPKRKARHIFRRVAEPDLDKVPAGQEFGGKVSH